MRGRDRSVGGLDWGVEVRERGGDVPKQDTQVRRYECRNMSGKMGQFSSGNLWLKSGSCRENSVSVGNKFGSCRKNTGQPSKMFLYAIPGSEGAAFGG